MTLVDVIIYHPIMDEGAPMASKRLDGIAALLSSLCLVHCMALPLALVTVPMFAQFADSLHGPDWLHWVLIGIALPASAFALWRGVRMHHDHSAMCIAAVGFALMAAGALSHGHGALEPVLTVAGGLVVAGAHWLNWSRQRALAPH